MPSTLLATSLAVRDWDSALVAMPPMPAVVRPVPARIACSDLPTSCESAAPSPTRLPLSSISCAISCAAVLERSASLRTSSATTAKPRPCSPALAASIAAFSASRLVWLAIWLITPMILAIWWLLSLIAFMPSIERPTAWLPCSALWLVDSATLLASVVLVATWSMLRESSCTEALISSTELACDCAPLLMFCAEADSSSPLAAVWSAAERISDITWLRLSSEALKAVAMVPISSLEATSTWAVRLPCASSPTAAAMARIGRLMLRASHRAQPRPMSSAAPPMAPTITRAWWPMAWAVAVAASSPLLLISMIVFRPLSQE